MKTQNNILDQYFSKRLSNLKRNFIIAVIFILTLFAASLKAQDRPKKDTLTNIYITAQGRTIRLTSRDTTYLLHFKFTRGAILNIKDGGTIRNNSTADVIIALLTPIKIKS